MSGQNIAIQGENYSTALTELKIICKDLTDEDIVPLQLMTNLSFLDLRGNRINNLSPLAGLSNLRKLWLDDNKITDVKPIARLSNLTHSNFAQQRQEKA